jgi:hypothetical protein
MASEKVVSAILVFIVTTAIFFIVNATFGSAMDTMSYTFAVAASHVTMSASWHAIIAGITSTTNPWFGWGTFFTAIEWTVIAVGVWVVKVIIIDTRYNKFGGFQQ